MEAEAVLRIASLVASFSRGLMAGPISWRRIVPRRALYGLLLGMPSNEEG